MGTGPSSTQSAPSAALQSLQDAFGPDVLVPLKEGVLSHASVMFGVLPLNNTFQAEDGEASRLYGVVCGGKPGLLADTARATCNSRRGRRTGLRRAAAAGAHPSRRGTRGPALPQPSP